MTVRLAAPTAGIVRVSDVGPMRKALFADPPAQLHGKVDTAA